MRRNIKQLVTIKGVMLVVLLWLTACGKSTEKQIAEQLELGNKYLTDGDYEQAIVAFNKVIELDPKMVEAYTGLIESFYGKKDYDEMANWINTGYEQLEHIDSDDNIADFFDIAISGILNSPTVTKDLVLVEKLYEKYEAIDYESFINKKDEITEMIQKQTGFLIADIKGQLLNEIQNMYKNNQLDELTEIFVSDYEILRTRDNNTDRIVYFGDCNGFLPNGFGIAIYGKNVKEKSILYVGEWKDGRRDGSGFDLVLDSDRGDYGYYIGEWKDDLPNGKAETHIKRVSGSVTEYIGTASAGYAEGIFKELFIGRDSNISGYEYNCVAGVPQSQGVGEVNDGEMTEDVMSFMLEPDGSKKAVWHTWAGLRCKECHDDESLDFLNTFDHKWSGWGDKITKYDFYVD